MHGTPPHLHLFVSAHFDDAIGSCGGTIARLRQRQERVRVLTIFGGPERQPFSFPATILHEEWGLDRPVETRRQEDIEACHRLDCERQVLDVPDAIYRQDGNGNHLYPTFESIREAPARADTQHLDAIVTAIDAAGGEDDVLFYFPLAIGDHVDHVLARRCGEMLAARRPAVSYRDFVYDRTWDGRLPAAAGLPVEIALNSAEVDRKRVAFAAYRSQISDLFVSEAGMDQYFDTIGRTELFVVPEHVPAAHQAFLRTLAG